MPTVRITAFPIHRLRNVIEAAIAMFLLANVRPRGLHKAAIFRPENGRTFTAWLSVSSKSYLLAPKRWLKTIGKRCPRC
jgi:hypothetical protein